MTTTAPYVGSKITLISKSEIRYDGILYDVDTKDATVTLSKVRSYGTEDRHVPKHIPARNEVYEYIVFRGSDIKDLTIQEVPSEDTSPHQDPAIVSTTLQHPPGLLQQPARLPSLLGMPGPLPTGRPPPSQMIPPPPRAPGQDFMAFAPAGFANTFRPFYPPMVMKPGPTPYTQNALAQGMLQLASTHPASLSTANSSTPISTASHISLISASPISLSESSSPSARTTSHSVVAQTTSASTQPPVSQPTIPTGRSPPSQAREPTTTTATGSLARMPGSPHQPGPQKGKTTIASQAVVRSLQGHSSAAPVRTSPPTVTFVTNELTQTKSMPKAKEVKVVVASTASPTEDSPPSPQLSRRAYSGSENRQQRQRGYGKRGRGGRERDRDMAFQEDSQSQPRGWRGGYRDGPNRYYNQRQKGRPAKGRGRDPKGDGGSDTKQTFRYDSDFDFETANARFDREQLEKEMKRMNIDDDERIGPGADVGGRRSPDVILVEDEEGDEHQTDGAGNKASIYKKDDFFDSISCESTQTSGSRRANRGVERTLNTETFGTYTRGYRGQGRYSYNRGGRYGRSRGGYQNYRYYDQRRGDYGGYQKSNFSAGGGRMGGSGRTTYGSKNSNQQSSEWKQPEQDQSVQQEWTRRRQKPPEQQPQPPKPDTTTTQAAPELSVTEN